MCSIKNFNNEEGIQIWDENCNNAGENVNFEQACKQEEVRISLSILPQILPTEWLC